MTAKLAEAWSEAEGLLRRAQRILAITHVNPDGDAIGSVMGFTLAMRQPARQMQLREILPRSTSVRQNASQRWNRSLAIAESKLGEGEVGKMNGLARLLQRKIER